MFICDAQIHLWAADRPDRPWPADGHARRHRPEPLGVDEALREMDRAGVDRAVLVPPSFEGDYNDLSLAAAKAHPDRFAVMGRVALEDPATPEKMARWRDQPGMLGVRLTFINDRHRGLLASGAVEPFWAAAEAAGVPVMVLPPDQISTIEAVARRHPKLKLVIDHLAMASQWKDDEAFRRVPEVLTLAACLNVAVKASALPCYTSEAYPYPSIQGLLGQVFDAFGPDRMFWGSDLSRLPCPYTYCITHFTETLPFLDTTAKERVMGKAICEWLGWPV